MSEELRRIEERLVASERARREEAEELLTRMGAVEVLIDHLNRRVGELDRAGPPAGSSASGGVPGDIDLRIGGIEYALDELGPLIGVPATIAALEQEVIALNERLELASLESQARADLISREIDARISVAESNLSIHQDAVWEGMQDAVNDVERGARDGEHRLEARLAEQAATAADALEDLEGRITDSLEALAGRMGTATSASGAIAEAMVGRLEMIERDIAEIEARFEGIPRTGAAPAPDRPSRPTVPEPESKASPAAKPGPAPAPPRAPAGLPRAAQPSRTVAEPTGPVNINEASFEVLRSLGCSVTQTARILAARKVRGGFSSPEELSDVPGLPAEFRAELISRLTV